MRSRDFILSAAVLAACVSCAASSAERGTVRPTTDGTPAKLAQERPVRTGDLLVINFYDLVQPELLLLSEEERVDDAGSIRLPLLSPLRVGGLTLREIPEAIRAAYRASSVEPAFGEVTVIRRPSQASVPHGEVRH